MLRLISWTVIALACVGGAAHAQTYPAKPVRYIVPFPAAASPNLIGGQIPISGQTAPAVLPAIPQEFAQFIRAETARWAKVIKAAGIPQE